MGDGLAVGVRPATLRGHWLVLVVLALAIVAVAALSGQFLCALIESPIVAPQREDPALYVVVMGTVWASLAVVACGFAAVGTRAARLTDGARRRWRLIAVGLVVSTWAVVVLLYLTNPLTIRRWSHYWPIFYG